MPAFRPVPPALAERFDACLPRDDMVQRRKMFGCPCAFVNGNMFAGVHEDRVILRLEIAERERVLAQGHLQPFEVLGRTMREYVVLPDPLDTPVSQVTAWIARAFSYARALPPKLPKAPKAKVVKASAAKSRRLR